ncbi:MAG: hypothetical protein ABJA66_20315 [Actinomycetota bacterium]
MWFEDLTIHSFGGRAIPRIASGWLENEIPFTRGETSQEVYEKLCKLNKNPWLDYLACGYHECEFCDRVPSSYPLPETYGGHNLTVPHEGKLYHYPEMITHYIKKHSYLPPEELCEAVLACPPMDSMKYYNKMLENGGKILMKCFEEFRAEIKK